MSYHFKAICDLLFLIFANLVYTGVSHLTPRQVGQEISGCNNPNSCVSVPAPAEEHPDVGADDPHHTDCQCVHHAGRGPGESSKLLSLP